MDNTLFTEMDKWTYIVMTPIIKKALEKAGEIIIDVKPTTPMCVTDASLTAMTCTNKYQFYEHLIIYSFELKNRVKEEYSFTNFWNAEKEGNGVLSKGAYIPPKKIESLLQTAKLNHSLPYYVMRFSDDVIAFWRIKDKMELEEVESIYNQYTVVESKKVKQRNKTLYLKNADLIYDNKTDTILQNLKKGLRYE